METMIYDSIIIGGGPAGLTAGIYLSKAKRSVLVIEKYIAGGQMSVLQNIRNYPGFDSVDGEVLSNRMYNQAKELGVEFQFSEVTGLSLQGEVKEVQCKGKTFMAKSVILATGISPKKLNILGENEYFGKGVSYCAVCDGSLFKDKVCAVVSTKLFGLKDVKYLSKICKKVYFVEDKNTNGIEVPENVEIINDKPAKILGDENVTQLELQNSLPISVDGIFVNVGKIPCNSLFTGLVELNEQGYVITDDNLQTSVEGVFACGDVRDGTLKQIVTACADGAVAGMSALKTSSIYDSKHN